MVGINKVLDDDLTRKNHSKLCGSMAFTYRVLSKWELHHPGLQKLIPHFDIDLRVDVGECRPYIAHADSFPQRRTLGSRGHPANGSAGKILDLIVMTGDALFYHLETDKLLVHTCRLLLLEDCPCRKILARSELGDP